MELITQEDNTGSLSRRFIRSGIAGNYEVIYEMIRVIRDSVNYDIGVERLAKSLLTDNGLDSYSPAERQLDIIYRFVKRNVEYVLDKAGLVESIKSARVTLSDGYGDCDDLTNTIATLVGDLGFENVFIAMARYAGGGSSFEHVYPVVYANKQRFVLDASLPNGHLNNEVEAVEIKEIPVFDTVEGLDGLSGVINNTRYHARKIGSVAVETLPTVAGYLPLGFASFSAMATGAQLLNHTASKDLSLNAVGSKINQELDKIIVSLTRVEMAHDLAVSAALQAASQLSAVNNKDDKAAYAVVKNSIQTKLDFIRDFENFAHDNDIHVVKLNAPAMLIAGVAGAGIGAYALYQTYRKRG